jgi:ligand-binding sensor domain-containing protein
MGRRITAGRRAVVMRSWGGWRSRLAWLALLAGAVAAPPPVAHAGELTMTPLSPRAEIQRTSLGNASGAEPVWMSWSIDAMIRAVTAHGDDVWIGTTNGLLRYNRRNDSHTLYTTKQGLLSNVILVIRVDAKGQVWVGTYGGGLSRFDPNGPPDHQWITYTPFGVGDSRYGAHWRDYRPGEGIGDLWVYDLLFEPDGTMWAATWKGASRFDGKRFHTYTPRDGLVDKWVYTLQRSPSGTFWFGTEGGVTRYTPKAVASSRWKSWSHDDGIGATMASAPSQSPYNAIAPHHETSTKSVGATYNPNYIITSALDRKGRLWVGTWGAGLGRFDGRTWKNYTTADGLSGNHVNSIAIDKDGRFWIGTDGGVTHLDVSTGRMTNYGQRDGLLGIPIYSITVDADGGAWFGTIGGVTRVFTP